MSERSPGMTSPETKSGRLGTNEMAGTELVSKVGLQSKWLVLLAIGVGSIMSTLDSSVANIILPVVSRALHSDVAAVEWVVTGTQAKEWMERLGAPLPQPKPQPSMVAPRSDSSRASPAGGSAASSARSPSTSAGVAMFTALAWGLVWLWHVVRLRRRLPAAAVE